MCEACVDSYEDVSKVPLVDEPESTVQIIDELHWEIRRFSQNYLAIFGEELGSCR